VFEYGSDTKTDEAADQTATLELAANLPREEA
jgi:hypothetical protein